MDEDNVVGALFLQNGEDNGYDPEDFVQELDVGESAPRFRISVADDDGGIPGSLFACAVWNGARFIAMHFAKHPELVKGRSVVEFGAASALPSLVALHFGAEVAVMTDYPNDLLLENIETNIKRNEHLLGSGRREVRGHLWGSDTTGVLKCLDASESTPRSFDAVGKESEDSVAETADGVEHSTKNRFDVAVVAECLWLHHLHGDLLKSIDACLAPEGKVFVSFAHHVPGHEQNDLSFFTKAKQLYGFDAVHLDTLASPHVFNADLLVDQYLYMLTRARAARDSFTHLRRNKHTSLKFLKMSSAPNHADPWGLGRRPTKEEMDRWADENSAKCLEYVKQHAEAGNPASVIATIDEFASTNHMMNIGPVKGAVIDEEIRKKKPAVMAELGAYTGYSTVRFASLQREVAGPDSHYYSFEYSPVFAARVREMVELAGLTNQVTVYVGEFSEQYEALRGKNVDLYFIDHEKSVYLSDLKLIIGSGTLAPGSIIAADNVVRPGAPDYLEFIENSPQFSTAKLQLREVLARIDFTLNDYSATPPNALGSAKCLEYVKQHAEAGNPASVIATIDEFASTNHMMNIGPVKGAVIDEEIRKKKPAVMAELGAYTGYSTVRFASLQREVADPDSHYYSFEYSPVFAARVREMVELAGLTNQVTVYVGEFSEQYEALRGKNVDLYFIDHEKSVYLSDLKLIIGSGTLAPGSIIAADNVVRPGAPDYLEFIENSPQFSTVPLDPLRTRSQLVARPVHCYFPRIDNADFRFWGEFE
ncbi:putative methyltransferase [Phytophthora cinnamomi]|uniref:putative methyltransferase n=1 Tax=Phytophthora cinnamomi TaxID=4785 RepID=UPI00355A5565|nr:putative methyltransferase [Phytophthora cinnamomi]